MAALTDDHLKALASVGERLGEATPRFALGGSGLLAAHGLRVDVGDLDVLVWRADIAKVLGALAPLGSFAELPGRLPWVSSWLMAGVVDGIRVEVICDLGYLQDDVHHSIPVGEDGTVGPGFPLSPLPYWYHLYTWYNPGKAELIRGVVPEEALRAALTEMIAFS